MGDAKRALLAVTLAIAALPRLISIVSSVRPGPRVVAVAMATLDNVAFGLRKPALSPPEREALTALYWAARETCCQGTEPALTAVRRGGSV